MLFVVFQPALAQSLAQPAVLATHPPTVHGRLAFDDDNALIEVERAQITIYAQGASPWSYSADGPFVGEGSTPALSVLRRGPTGLWAVYRPDVGIPRIRGTRPETPTWHLMQGEVAWTADPALCRVPIGADADRWLAVNTTDVACSEARDLQVFAHDGESQAILPLPPGFRLLGHGTLLPVAALGDGVAWVIAGGTLWRHDGQWSNPFEGAWTHVLAHGDRVLPVRKAGGWALRTASGDVLVQGDELVLGAAFSDDGRWLALGLERSLRVLDAHTGQDRLAPRPGRYQAPHAFSGDGNLLAVSVSGQPLVLGLDGATLPSPADIERFEGTGLVSRTPEDLACRGSIVAPASSAKAWRVDADHGLFPTEETAVVDGVARFDDVPCGRWRVESTDFVDVWVGPGDVTTPRADLGASRRFRVVGADGAPTQGAQLTMVDLHWRILPLGVTDADGLVGGPGTIGPFGVLMAETADSVGAVRTSAGAVGVTLIAKADLWQVRA